jgi:uncharacterized integral membrane protein
MGLGYLVVAVLAAAVVVFAFQNGTPLTVRFLMWNVEAVSAAAVVAIALVSGVLLAGIPLWIQRWRLRSRVRGLETQVRQLEAAVTERDKALAAPRPAPKPNPPPE